MLDTDPLEIIKIGVYKVRLTVEHYIKSKSELNSKTLINRDEKMNKVIVLLIAAVIISAEASSYFERDVLNIEGRVINGQLAAINQFPWHVSIEGNLTNGQPALCGGALISNAFVLTAAHCVLK